MAQYIDRADVIRILSETPNCMFCQDVVKIVDKILAADVVEVVRCKDCKHWELSFYNTFGIHVCKKFGGVRGEHDYCSRCERKETEDE